MSARPCLPILVASWLLVGCNDAPDPKDPVETDPPSDTEPPSETDPAETDVPTDTDTDPDPGAVTEANVITCGELPATTSGVCDVTVGAGEGTVFSGIVLDNDTVWEGGSVVVDGSGEITCVGCDCADDAAAVDATVISCPDGAISPGLINPHDHLTYSEASPNLEAPDRRYDHRHDWRGSLSVPRNAHGSGSTANGNRWVEIRQLIAGTTAIIGSGWAEGLVRNPDEGTRGSEGLDIPTVLNQTFPLGDANESRRSNCDWSYPEDEWEIANTFFYVPHVAEGINDRAAEEFRCLSTSFDGGQDYTEANVAHVHGIGLTAEDYWKMVRDDTKLVWSPRSNISLYGHTAQVRLFHTLGGTISLGTDWTYSGSTTPVRELACADYLNSNHYNSYFNDVELWKMVTVNAAASIGLDDQLGRLAPGYVADIAIFDASTNPYHRAVIDAEATDVVLVARAGEVLYGEADTLVELGDPCDGINVCGEYRAICTSREFGEAYEDIEDDVSSGSNPAYPAFFCGEPTDEPTCVPERDGEFDGQVTADDADGDGIDNMLDACPDVFDPVRPMDNGVQPDRDADGIGDACDETPLPEDLDGDGYLNDVDNCPFDSNPDQIDFDNDGRGDLCDYCAEVANPLEVCPPAPPSADTIFNARTVLADGVDVLVQGVVVTGVGNSGYFIQDPSVTNGQNAGIYVFTGGTPTVSLGDEVDVAGELDTYFDERQLAELYSTVLASGVALPTPVPLTISDARDEMYEGTLVTLTDGAVTNDMYDCGVDGPQCGDEGLWELDGSNGLLVYDRLYGGADWDAQIGTLPVTGVMGFRWNRRRIMPRVDSDFGP
jgi:cytosine/adenosine deaminase-related metal-dependent hydrolase